MRREFAFELTLCFFVDFLQIRTPIGGILGCIELLMDGSMETLSAEQESLVMIIRHSAKVLMALINDILDLSKVAKCSKGAVSVSHRGNVCVI